MTGPRVQERRHERAQRACAPAASTGRLSFQIIRQMRVLGEPDPLWAQTPPTSRAASKGHQARPGGNFPEVMSPVRPRAVAFLWQFPNTAFKCHLQPPDLYQARSPDIRVQCQGTKQYQVPSPDAFSNPQAPPLPP